MTDEEEKLLERVRRLYRLSRAQVNLLRQVLRQAEEEVNLQDNRERLRERLRERVHAIFDQLRPDGGTRPASTGAWVVPCRPARGRR